MTFDLAAADYTLSGLRPFPVAVTTISNGRVNGLVALSNHAGEKRRLIENPSLIR